jgi:hypothetical protein
MPTLLPHKIEKENPAQKWGNLVAKSERAVGSNLIIYSDLSRRSSPQPLPRQPSLARTPKLNYMIQSPTSTSIIEHVGKLDWIVRAKEKNAIFARVCSTWRELQSCTPHEDIEKTP